MKCIRCGGKSLKYGETWGPKCSLCGYELSSSDLSAAGQKPPKPPAARLQPTGWGKQIDKFEKALKIAGKNRSKIVAQENMERLVRHRGLLVCVHCGSVQTFKPDELECTKCGREFHIVPPTPRADHYHTGKGNTDVIQFAKENYEAPELRGFYRINIIKYVSRYHKKGGLADLDKAQDYLNLLRTLEEEQT